MLNQDHLIETVAAFKKDSRRHFNVAVASLIALAWPHRKDPFTFDEPFPGHTDALDICIDLSDKCVESARKRLNAVVEDSLDYYDEDAAWDEAFGDDILESFDMAGTHLLDLLAVWIGIAVANGWTDGYTRVMVSRYLANPFTCPEWRAIPLDALAWGRGYAKDVAEQLALIGQGIIVKGARYAERADAMAKGYTYYIRRRGSDYDCGVCEALANKPIPIDTPFEIPHPRCVCYPEYYNQE